MAAPGVPFAAAGDSIGAVNPTMIAPHVIVFCADTDTGYRLTKLLARAERRVTACVRPGADSRLVRPLRCELVVVPPADRDAVAAVFDGAEAPVDVVCMLGGSPQMNSQGNINVIDAAAAHGGVRRFVLLTTIGCGDSEGAVDPFVKAFIGKAIRAKNWAEKRLRASGLPWTIVRPGSMVRRATKGEPILVDNPNVAGYINVFDLGDLVFRVLEADDTLHRVLAAVDSGKAYNVRGEPLVPAEL